MLLLMAVVFPGVPEAEAVLDMPEASIGGLATEGPGALFWPEKDGRWTEGPERDGFCAPSTETCCAEAG